MPVIPRRPLRDQVQLEIRERIIDGRLPAGASLNEVRLSGDLGISRTPLREAMLALEATGFLASAMGHGFRVPTLEAAEFLGLAAMLARLEPLAIASSPDPSAGKLMEMQNLVQRARLAAGQPGPRTTAAAAALLPGFSALLLGGCPNAPLRQDVMRLHALGARYWFAAVAAGFPAGALVAYVEKLYAEVHARRRAAAADHIAASLEPLADQATTLLP
ncbi:MAG TPA: GntR family transcriptional regulator [Candidatus Krumholzibacteria bacterium]|nr:GntR family transcriptional regulator [Candidatus Krumholzibacteria bacterium]